MMTKTRIESVSVEANFEKEKRSMMKTAICGVIWLRCPMATEG
jgi:hypothetical protein